jgi:predicted O-methyltransferase YrrM
MNILYRAWIYILKRRSKDCVTALRLLSGPAKRNLETLPPGIVPKCISGFEDLSYLFTSSQANRGIIAQDFDEAAYLWKIVRDLKPKYILEIGRWLGGSTILLASAANVSGGGRLISVDLKVKAPQYAQDDTIKLHLNKLGLTNFELHVGSSYTFDPKCEVELAFIDGDHSYEGVKKDFENASKYLTANAEIVFHDAAQSRAHSTYHIEVGKFMEELKRNPALLVVSEVGSIIHFRKISVK